MEWVAGRIDAVAPTALEHTTRRREGHAITVSLLGFLLVLLFTAAWVVEGGLFESLAYLSTLLILGPLLYVAWVSHVAYRRAERPASSLVLAVGATGMTTAILSSVLLTARTVVPIPLTPGTLGTLQAAGLVLTGLWFVGASALELVVHLVSRWVAYFGFVAGIGGILTGAGAVLGGMLHPLFLVGTATSIVGFVPWVVVLRSHLLAEY